MREGLAALITAFALVAIAAPARAQTEWTFHRDGAHPDGNEQAFLWLLNRARQDPAAEGVFLATVDDPDVAASLTFFGVDTEALQDEFAALAPVPPAAFDRRLYQAALASAQLMLGAGAASDPDQLDRILPAGFVYPSVARAAGNAYGFARSALHGHATWNVDWLLGGPGGMAPGRPHRAAIMDTFSNAGIAVLADPDPDPGYGPLVAVADYADANTGFPDHYNRFLVGTVWEDLDGDDVYAAGEGLSGVVVMTTPGSFFAVTAAGGGYAIPITSPGMVEVDFSGGGAPAASFEVSVGAQSVLVDYVVPEPGALAANAVAALALAALATGRGRCA